MKARYASFLIVFFMPVLLAGCITGSSKLVSRFYVLNAMNSSQKAGTSACRDARILVIGIAPLKLPKFLDRPQIVTRINNNELNLSEVNLWAEPLKDNVPRVLGQNLRQLLCADIRIFPWTGSTPMDYLLSLRLIRFDGTPGGEASLEVQWSVFDQKTDKLLYTRESRFSEPVRKDSYDALVSAYSRLLASFSRELADTFSSIPPGKSVP